MSVIAGYCSPDNSISPYFHQSICRLLLTDRHTHRIEDVIHTISGPRIATARNDIVNHFLTRRTADWLWMLDTDMTFNSDTLTQLLDTADPDERPILGALCFAGQIDGTVTPTIYRINEDGRSQTIEGIGAPGEWGRVVRVHATGAACLLMHRSALEKIGAKYRETGHPWFAETALPNRQYGEDVTFCLRAHAMDIPVHVHTGVTCGHIKPGVLDEQSFSDYLRRRDEAGGDAEEANELIKKAYKTRISR